jgi:type VI secretion system protein ImpH
VAGTNGRAAAPVTLSVPVAASDELASRAYAFDFSQAVRLLEMLSPHSVPVGEGADPQREPVRFRSSFSLAFPASELLELRPGAEPDPPELVVNFLGLGGALGPLPHALTEWVLARIAAKDFALRDFLDIFNHRLVSIFFRSRRKSRLGMEWTSPEEQRFADYLRAILGLLGEGLKERMAIPDRALLGYAGLLNKRPRDMTGLAVLLRDHFEVGVEVRPLRGAFRPLAEERHTRLGAKGQNRALGETAILGTRVWDQQAGIELRLGPLPFARYTDFLPGRPGHLALWQLVRFYIGPALDIHVTLLVQGADIPPARLGNKGTAVLGQAAFLSLGSPLGGLFVITLGVLRAFTEPEQNPAQKGRRVETGGMHGNA